MTALVGEGRPRVDAAVKVTGSATYTAEHQVPGLLHAVFVLATIARGRISAIDLSAAEDVSGYVGALTHENAPRLNGEITGRQGLDKHLLLMQDDAILFDRQPVAIVVARTLEAAQEAAARVHVTYVAEPPIARIDDPSARVFTPEHTAHDEPPEMTRGDAAHARATADVLVQTTYSTPFESHNPIEPHASIAQWTDDRLTIYDATQGVFEVRRKLAGVFGLAEDAVRVISPYVGGGFGNKGSVWYHQCLAAAVARVVDAPVKLVLTREQMFALTGHRAHTVQHVTFGASRDGRVHAFEQDVIADTSTFDIFTESSGEYSAMAYAFENVDIRHRLVRMNIGTPTFMRAPGEATGTFVLEAALDELAYAVDIDPIELRLRNFAETDPNKGLPFSSKRLRECYARGAELIGWNRRTARPRALREGNQLIGLGMAGGAYPSQIFNASATVMLLPDKRVVVRSGTHELGQGTYTAIAQITATELGIDPDRVGMELGDTAFPRAMNSGGSTTIASVGSAVALACRKLRASHLANGEWPATMVSAQADFAEPQERKKYSCASFAAQFAEVAVDADFGTVRVRRMVGVFDVGRVINERLTRSQLIGGMTMGLGMALLEETQVDPNTARIMNASLGEYLIPVNADIADIVVETVPCEDPIVNAIGTKPVGEIGICGAAAAIANAVYHATGRRIRELPIGARVLC